MTSLVTFKASSKISSFNLEYSPKRELNSSARLANLILISAQSRRSVIKVF